MRNYILSYPHSGNTWLRYCIEYVTKRRTIGHQDFSISERKNNFLEVNQTLPSIAVKRHELNLGELNGDDTLILLVRNPYECIKADTYTDEEFLKYYSHLLLYDHFDGQKLVLEYNSLFDRSLKYMERVFDLWRGKNNPDYNCYFMKMLSHDFNNHLAACKSIYTNETNREGANLEHIPKIYFQHPILQELYDSEEESSTI